MKLTKNNQNDYLIINKFTRADALAVNYSKKLMAVVKKMNAEIIQAISKEYGQNEAKIAFDASPANELNKTLKDITDKYIKFLKEKSPNWARDFIDEISVFTKQDLKRKAKEKGLNIDFDKSSRKMLYKQRALILENAQLITSIPEQTQTQIQGDVMRAMSEGRDMGFLKEQLRQRGIHNEKRVNLIARDQLSKATTIFNTQRATDAGFTQAVWLHSHGGKTQRKSHVQANMRIYDLNKGCPIDGALIYPGQEINCRCNFKLIYKIRN